ncbi:PEP-CTERM system TPR-repeat protein PrsT [Neiella marina]|uniref:PEP-CTERM system TPR-repeat protein PrsT n=1 Tax=Neiella holothuriorum TaxID=2870530 RepID=A0ABS7EGZ0_9GAMM|nr:XrtA/PEP-CTERM system TPR-repeat protein PrsT [Neiella holothuriorum]MBW8191611.1 PEP-CTERM system TPR-repeat protein PrsT [Neiella holothuriorum]
MKGLLKPITAATLLTLAACGAEKTSEQYLASAQQYLASGDKNAAVIELKNSLRQAPTNIVARQALGDIYYEQGAFEFAEKEYLKALNDSADANELAPKLAITYYKTSKFREIEQLAEEYQRLSPEAAATMSAIQSLSYFQRGEQDKAQDYLNIAEQKQADNIYARLGQTALNLSTSTQADLQSNLKVALQTVDEIISVAPGTIEAYLLKGHLLMAKKQYEQAESTFDKMMKQAPGEPRYAIYKIQSQLKQDKFEEAEPAIDQLLAIAPEHPTINEYKARVLHSRQDFGGAQTHSTKAIQNGSSSVANFVVAGISAMKQGDLEQAYRHLSQVQKNLPNDHITARIYAYLQLQLGYTEEALLTLDQLTELQDSDAALFASATSALSKSGDKEKALGYAEKAAELDHSSARMAQLGLLKLRNEDTSGLDDLEQAIRLNPDLTEARLALVYSLLQRGEDDLARQAADEMIQAFPEDARGYALKGMVEQKLGNFDAAETQIDKALTITPNEPVTLLSKIKLLLEQEKESEAFELQKQNLQHNANKFYVVSSFVNHAIRYQHIDQAILLFQSLRKDEPTSANLAWGNAALLTSSNQIPEAVALLSALGEDQHHSASNMLLGDLLVQTRSFDKAEAAYKPILASQPNKKQTYQRLIAVNELQGNFADAVKYAELAVKQFPQDQSFNLLKAVMLFDNGQINAANTTLQSVAEPFANHHVATRLRARIAMENKAYSQAAEHWQKYYQAQPSLDSLLNLAKSYELNNERDKASQLLDTELANHQVKYPIHLKLAELAMAGGNSGKAIDHYESALAESPDNVIALNNTSWLQIEAKQYPQAEAHALRAYQLSDKNPVVADTYGLSLLRQGKANEALTILEPAYLAQTDNTELALHYAEALIATDQKPKAKRIIERTQVTDDKLLELKKTLVNQL